MTMPGLAKGIGQAGSMAETVLPAPGTDQDIASRSAGIDADPVVTGFF